ncbi:glycosyltransferase family 4 protein [Mucilaginibacter sp. UR6-11]|uniref:glycosyltransferase family 4 protein n=1 Tax=Mucilaginibacter sp. UR6-11 TaxID=1435644 RepID=UPI001E527284|nr:glycosyltransferase family 4 protein [Mucilaginibacter sp. UR6-11]MCC8426153.1 glycosyltransferase family 4 protein [Mucilaginibacter sp. UR6-11]
MQKIILSAFACEPGKGSEEGNGWHWASGLAGLGYEVHCLTRSVNRTGIESYPAPANLHFHYVAMPAGSERLFHMGPFIYVHYMAWQYLAYQKAKKLHKDLGFDIAHHVSWGSLQMGSHLYKLKIPFIFGPAGGGQHAPKAFKKYFGHHWVAEIKREKISNLLVKYNPACKNMLQKAHAVLVSNSDTLELVKSLGAKNYYFSLDTALPESFFPAVFKPKVPQPGKLKLLWVGRFMPRKGVLLTLEVMRALKAYPQISLTIVGYGETEEEIAACIREYGLQDTVTLTGKVPYDEVRGYYDSHDVFFFTSLRDSCPAQLLEAAAFGTPVVTLNLHGQALLVNDDTGIRCNVTTPDATVLALKDALLDLYNNPDKITKMSHEAVKFAKKQTWPAKIAAITKDHYPV